MLRSTPPLRPTTGRTPARSREPGFVTTGLTAGLPWLAIRGGALYDSAGRAVRLIGVDDGEASGARSLHGAFAAVPEGRRCIALSLRTVADLTPAALARLDTAIAAHAAAGAYTLLRMSARLWLHGRQVALARRYAGNPAVLFALSGRQELADKLVKATLALRQAHPGACVWLPLESARTAFALLPDPCVGLLWDAARPQAPRPPALAGGARAPVLLDGWWPDALHPLSDERLMRLCREGGIGWLARQAAPSAPSPRITQALQRAVYLSLLADPSTPSTAWPLAA